LEKNVDAEGGYNEKNQQTQHPAGERIAMRLIEVLWAGGDPDLPQVFFRFGRSFNISCWMNHETNL